ncbi:MAG: MATE family efflux transporter [Clostridia bacterium]|nr:MATE family efflux transporter [Clostridia bacterium]
MAKKRYEIDMCRGPLVKNILRFALPLVLSGILQLLFSAADLAVVGRCVSDTALAAVGATNSVTSLVVVLFSGLSAGVNLVVARLYGAGNHRGIQKAVHTAIALALIGGGCFAVAGLLLSGSILRWMDTPAEVYDAALKYMRIVFLGIPASMIYNFGAAILRSHGDTKRPFYYITCAGALNVGLNLVFVLWLGMAVEGVALGTVISQYVSAILVFRCLLYTDGPCRISLRGLRLYKDVTAQIARVGLPAGLQSAVFSIAGVLIQTSINSLGKNAMVAYTAVSNLENLVCTALNALAQATLCFVSQNFGAKQYRRIRRVQRASLLLSLAAGFVLSMLTLLLGDILLRIYTNDPVALVSCKELLLVSMAPFFLCGIMQSLGETVRGLGYAVTPMVSSLVGVCGLRVLWIYTVFARFPNLTVLYLSFPAGWIVTSLAHFVTLAVVWRKLPKEDAPLPATVAENP